MSHPPAAPVAVLDANVLYPAFLRDVLLNLATGGLFRPRWSDHIHKEWIRSLLRNRPDLSPEKIRRTRMLMDSSFPEARVPVPEGPKPTFSGVHVGDRHVAVTAWAAGAPYIVTHNRKHFPNDALHPLGITAISPDDFVARLFELNRDAALTLLEIHRGGLRSPPHTRASYRQAFLAAGLTRSAEHLPK